MLLFYSSRLCFFIYGFCFFLTSGSKKQAYSTIQQKWAMKNILKKSWGYALFIKEKNQK